MFYRYIRVIVYILLKILFHFQVRGGENLKKVKGAILAVNHSSFVDPVLAGVASPRPLYFLARKDLFRNKFFGWLIRSFHAIPFNRDFPDTVAIRNVVQLLQNGKIVLVFPEGTRSPNGNLLPPHPGIGFIALKAKVPIVPMYIKGAHRILPREARFIRLAKAGAKIGEPIYLDMWLKKEHPERSDYEEVACLVMQRIRQLANLP